FDESKCYFDLSKINIAIHIRQYTSTDCDNNGYRNLYVDNEYNINKYSNIIKYLIQQIPNCVIHIYSQGDIDKFTELTKISDQLVFHLDEHPIISLHHMIKADILIMARSSLSYVASYYSKGIKYIEKGSYTFIPDI